MRVGVTMDISDYGPQPRPGLSPADQVVGMTRLTAGGHARLANP
jgi:hypothetical protein